MDRAVTIEASIDEKRIGSRQLAIAALCGLLAMIDGFDAQAMAFAAPEIGRELGIPGAHFGPVFSAGMLGSLTGVLVQGPLGDRYGRKTIMLAAFVVVGAASLAIIPARGLEALILLRFLEGVGLGAALPNLFAITSEYVPRRKRSTFVTAMFCGVPLGSILGGIATAQLLPELGWRMVFWLGGIAPLALLPLAWLVIPESFSYLLTRHGSQHHISRILRQIDVVPPTLASEPGVEARVPERIRSILPLFEQGRRAGTLLLWAISFLSLLVSISLTNWLPIVLDQAGIGISMAVINSVVLSGGGMLGALVFATLSDRRDAYRVLVPAYVIGAVFVGSIGAVPASGTLVTVIVFLAGFFFIGAQMCLPSLIALYYPGSLRASGLGWTMGIGRVGAIVGPTLAGVLLAWSVVPSTLFILAAVVTLLAAAAVGAMGHIYGRQLASGSVTSGDQVPLTTDRLPRMVADTEPRPT